MTIPPLLFAVAVLLLEGFCQLIKYDFGIIAAWNETPIYYRQPTVPVGEVFFRRPGNIHWTGRVLSKQFGCYPDEKQITITYDEHGFRNPHELSNWEIVVVGDSFTELGHLPYESLFTSKIADTLHVRVKNLGASYTGAFTHNCYLKEFGIAENTTDAVLVFFEGNDIRDILKEYEQLQKWETTGLRKYRLLSRAKKDSSFIIAISRNLLPSLRREQKANAVFVGGDATIPIEVAYVPPNKEDLNSDVKNVLNLALAKWAEIATMHNIRPWLVYMPCKARVLHNHLRFFDRTESKFVEWSPSDLPGYISQICQRNRIRFIDVTRVLAAETQRGILTYNHIGDTHLNLHGSLIVGQAISDALLSDLRNP